MKIKGRQAIRERMERASATSLSAAEVITTVRRLGFVALKMHEVIMSRLMRESPALAEEFNDVFKPAVDWLLHFEMSEREGEGDVDEAL